MSPDNISALKIHQECSSRVDYIGDEREPVLVIDNLFANANLLVEYAAERAQFKVAAGMYPGIRAPVPDAYTQALHGALAQRVCDVFGVQSSDVQKVECAFSMIAKPPEQLHPMQRIPHFDSNNPRELAVIHYLCSPSHGGTSFYKHIGSGYESVDATRRGAYFSALDRDAHRVGLPEPGYINGDTEIFRRIASYEARFNRALVYRCTSLHSGDITVQRPFNTDPRTGRLSVNTFLVGA